MAFTLRPQPIMPAKAGIPCPPPQYP